MPVDAEGDTKQQWARHLEVRSIPAPLYIYRHIIYIYICIISISTIYLYIRKASWPALFLPQPGLPKQKPRLGEDLSLRIYVSTILESLSIYRVIQGSRYQPHVARRAYVYIYVFIRFVQPKSTGFGRCSHGFFGGLFFRDSRQDWVSAEHGGAAYECCVPGGASRHSSDSDGERSETFSFFFSGWTCVLPHKLAKTEVVQGAIAT